MDIIRNGKHITLTNKELEDAYYEQQHKYDIEAVSELIPNQYFSRCQYDKHEEFLKRLKNDPELCSEFAWKWRDCKDDAIDEWNLWSDVYTCFISEHK